MKRRRSESGVERANKRKGKDRGTEGMSEIVCPKAMKAISLSTKICNPNNMYIKA
jgi:hypothetical protein